MKIAIESVINLLHVVPSGVLATHSAEMPGYPFLSIVPFAPDEAHRPIVLLSGLAEHTKNRRADPRASFLIAQSDGSDVQAGTRLTLVGTLEACPPSPGLVARYLRYQPTAENLLNLPDFQFYRLSPLRIRIIEGFGRMGWVEGHALLEMPVLSADQESLLLERLAPEVPAGVRVLGMDYSGVDIERNGERLRWAIGQPPTDTDPLLAGARAALRLGG